MSRSQGEQLCAPCARLGNASAAACHGHSARRRRSSRRPSPLSKLVQLFSFSAVTFVALLYSIGDLSADEALATPQPHPRSASTYEYKTWAAMKNIGKHAAGDARLAYRTAKRAGLLVAQHASKKAQAVGGKIYENTKKAYGLVASTSRDALRAARRALGRIRTAARSAWESTRNTPKKMWRATGRGVQHVGKWMLREGDGNGHKVDAVALKRALLETNGDCRASQKRSLGHSYAPRTELHGEIPDGPDKSNMPVNY